jgi:hypothetical protein
MMNWLFKYVNEQWVVAITYDMTSGGGGVAARPELVSAEAE